MTAVLAYLRSLSVAEWIGIAAASWLILAVLGSAGMARAAHVLKRRPRRRAVAVESDLDWLFDQPDDVWLTAPVVRDRCRQIEIAEGWRAA